MAITTSRRWTIDDLIVEFEDTMKRERRTVCPITDRLKAKRDSGEWVGEAGVELFEQWIFDPSRTRLGIPYIITVIITAGTHHPPDIAAEIQEKYAIQLGQYPWETIRGDLEALLHTEGIVYGIAPEAMRVLVGYIRDHHPNPKHFCAKPQVHAKIPEDVDMSDWRCDDFPHLEPALLKGGGPKQRVTPAQPQHTLLTQDPGVHEHPGVVVDHLDVIPAMAPNAMKPGGRNA